jgi:hypothetical protein
VEIPPAGRKPGRGRSVCGNVKTPIGYAAFMNISACQTRDHKVYSGASNNTEKARTTRVSIARLIFSPWSAVWRQRTPDQSYDRPLGTRTLNVKSGSKVTGWDAPMSGNRPPSN